MVVIFSAVGCGSEKTPTQTTPPTTTPSIVSPTTSPTPTPTPTSTSTLTPTLPTNNPPDKPVIPSGENEGQTGITYSYFTASTDADDDSVKYVFNWGDGNTSETEFTASGITTGASHAWSSPGTYFVTAKAIDSAGSSSDWSEVAEIVITSRTFDLTTDVNPPFSGLVDPSHGTFTAGATVTIKAIPSSGKMFDHWGGDVSGNSNPINISVQSDMNVIAYFVPTYKSEPTLEWQKTFGGEEDDVGYSVMLTSDGGYIVCGYTLSYGSGNTDVYLIKVNSNGEKAWEKTYGGTKADSGYMIQSTADGGYIIIGETQSFSKVPYDNDSWLIKTDANGNQQWNTTFSYGFPDWGWSVQQTQDNGYIVTSSYAGGRGREIILTKTDSTGGELWYKTFGGDSDKGISSVQQTSDGGYIIIGDQLVFEKGMDIWLIKTNAKGNIMWERTFGGSGYDTAYSVKQTADEGFIIVGKTESYGEGKADIWLLKTDLAGYEVWNQTFGYKYNDCGYSIQITPDGGYVIAGEKSLTTGNADVWVIKTDSGGNLVWDQTFGGLERDTGKSIQLTPDGGYIIAGETESYGSGKIDVLLIKLTLN